MAGAIVDFYADNDNSVSFKIKTKKPESKKWWYKKC